MGKKSGDQRGTAGAIALKNAQAKVIKENKKKLIKALNYFSENQIPLVNTELAEIAQLSVSTLGRNPYKEIVSEYKQKEKVLLSPKGTQEVAKLIKENTELKLKVKELEEKYKRLKTEITYSKELFS